MTFHLWCLLRQDIFLLFILTVRDLNKPLTQCIKLWFVLQMKNNSSIAAYYSITDQTKTFFDLSMIKYVKKEKTLKGGT